MTRPAVLLALLLVVPTATRAQVVPHRSFQRLVTGNGYVVASYDRSQKKLDFLLEHPYRFAHPRADAADLCFAADESRDLLYDTYFGVRTPTTGEWTNELPLDDATGGHSISVTQHGGAGRALRVSSWTFAPMGFEGAALVMQLQLANEGDTPIDVTPYALFNFHLGDAAGGREPSADAEQVSWDAARGVFYEFSDASQGTIAYVPLSGIAHASASTGGASAFNALHARADLDDVRATSAPTSDVAPGLEGSTQTLAPGAVLDWSVAVVWALDENAGPKVDALRAWIAGRTPDVIRTYVEDSWLVWHGGVGSSTDSAVDLIRMAQVREPGPGLGQILASLPPAFGDPNATWNITWVRDMTYAIVALAQTGHLQEAHDALAFMVHAGPGRHTMEVGRPYRISVTRYFGDGEEQSDCNSDGPNIEFDGFGLFLWALDAYAQAGGSLTEIRSWFPTIRDEVADVLVSLIGPDGVIVPDSSIWEVHWNGKQRRFTYTSLAAARGLCSAADVATMLGETDASTRWSTAGARVRDAVVARHTDAHSVLAQSAEDLLAGHGYLDASAVEAINWGIVDPHGRTAQATLTALRENLTVASGHGLMRNDDGGFYDSQEWVFIDERASMALSLSDEAASRDLRMWVDAQTAANDGLPSELYDPASGDYGGSPPMIGFGAAATVLGPITPAACGAYAPEPLPPLVDAGVPDLGTPDGSSGDAGTGGPKSGCGCTTPGTRTAGGWLGILFVISMLVFRRRVWVGPLAALFLVACGDDPDIHRDAGPDAMVRDGAVTHLLCPVTLTYRETSAVPMVHAAGDWNSFSMTADRLVDDGTGTYSVTLSLSPGIHPYKLYVEGDGADPWRFDPANPYRIYSGTPREENSGLRVPDCRVPGLTITSTSPDATSFRATLHYAARSSAVPGTVVGELRSDGATTRRLLDATELRQGAAGTIFVELVGLTTGKYTVEVAPIAADGTRGDDVLMPFWIGTTIDWHDAVIYMVMTDRYRNGDPSNDGSAPTAGPGAGWEGGDYQGITQSIDDGTIPALGVNTLWISPFNDNPSTLFPASDGVHQVSGYHGYWPTSPSEVDSRFGGGAALHTLIREAHAHGIRVLMDLVVNHVHQEHPYFRDHPDWFNPSGCVCGTPGCDWTAMRLTCWFEPYMPDIDWEVPAANEQFIGDALRWMEDYDLDGFRIDAVKHVVDSAITNLGTRVRERFETAGTPVFLMGETAMGWDPTAGPDAGGNVENYGTIKEFIGPHALSGQFDFVLYYAAALAFTADMPGRGLSHVEFWTQASQREYGPNAIMTPYIGSQDTSRFITLTADPGRSGNQWDNLPTAPSTDEAYDRMYLALAWLMAIPGAPVLYYGDEYGEFGGADPDNRHMWRARATLSPREQRQLDRVSALVHARAAIGAGRAIQTITVSDDLWVFTTQPGSPLTGPFVVLNRSPSPTTVTIPVGSAGAPYRDALAPMDTFAVQHGAIDVTVAGRSARYLLPPIPGL